MFEQVFLSVKMGILTLVEMKTFLNFVKETIKDQEFYQVCHQIYQKHLCDYFKITQIAKESEENE